MLKNHAVYKYETPYEGPFLITRCFTNVMLNSKYGLKNIIYNICNIKPYKSDTKDGDINQKNRCDYVKIRLPVIYFCIKIKVEKYIYNRMSTYTLKLYYRGRARDVFHENVTFFT